MQAVYASVNAGQTPSPENPTYVADEGQNPTGPTRTVNASWYRINGSSAQVRYTVTCVNPSEAYLAWMTVSPDGSGTLVPQIRAIDLVPALHARVVRQLPTPVTRIGPADEHPNGYAFVQNRTFFWIDQSAGQWEPVTGTASVAGISVTVRADPLRLVVDPGDGTGEFNCDGTARPVTSSNYSADAQGCVHIYRDSSSMSANGQTFPVTTRIVWHVTWSANTGEGGDLGFVSTTSAVRELPVAEIQALITDG